MIFLYIKIPSSASCAKKEGKAPFSNYFIIFAQRAFERKKEIPDRILSHFLQKKKFARRAANVKICIRTLPDRRK